MRLIITIREEAGRRAICLSQLHFGVLWKVETQICFFWSEFFEKTVKAADYYVGSSRNVNKIYF